VPWGGEKAAIIAVRELSHTDEKRSIILDARSIVVVSGPGTRLLDTHQAAFNSRSALLRAIYFVLD